jgi:hypothetical protein
MRDRKNAVNEKTMLRQCASGFVLQYCRNLQYDSQSRSGPKGRRGFALETGEQMILKRSD